MIVIPIDQLGNGDEFIALLLKGGDDSIQGSLGVFGYVVAADVASFSEILVFFDFLYVFLFAIVLLVPGVNFL